MSADELDVDAELLAMAGDDSSDEEGSDAGEVVDRTQAVDARTPSEEPKPSVEKTEEQPASSRRGVAQKVRKRGGRKKVTKREIEDELDDLADSPSPPGSQSSDAMSESPDGSPARGPPSPISDEPLFPVEGKFLSSSDRATILQLPEIEREGILAERAALATKRDQDLQLRKALAASDAAASRNKRKATAAELEDGSRKSSRPKTEKVTALDHYRKAREAKGAERTGQPHTKKGRDRRRNSSSSGSDRDAAGESEVEWADTASRSADPPAERRDFERCRVGRSNFAKILFYPNFDDTMKDCYCRVSIGLNRETGQNMYRMTQIKGFIEGKPYMLEAGPNTKSFMCDVYAIVAHGKAEKPWPLSACSDSQFKDTELDRYLDTLQKEKLRIPKKAMLTQKVDDINRFIDPRWDEATLASKFAKQRAMEKRLDPANAAKAKRDAIEKRQTDAQAAGDDEALARCEAELAALSNSAQTNGSASVPKGSPPKSQSLSQLDKLALINQKNRSKNANDVRQALLEERRKQQIERERAIGEARARAAAKAAAEAEAARKKQQADMLAVPGKEDMRELFGDLSDMSRAGTPVSGVSTPKMRKSRAGTPMNGIVGQKSRLGFGARKVKDEEIDELGGMGLEIDVEI